MKVLLSINPPYVDKIFNGEKKFEYRRAIFKDNSVDTIVIYSTSPIKKVVGEFKVKAEIGGPIVVRFPILLIYLAANQYKINAEDKTILFVFLQYVENQCTFLRVGQSSYSKVGLEYIF